MRKKKSPKHILFYSIELNPRIQYISQLLFEQLLGLELIYTQNKEEYLSSRLAKVHYGKEWFKIGEFFIPSHSLLFEKKIKKQKFEVYKHIDLPMFFHLNKLCPYFTFDLLAMCFYLVTRYEEYLPFEADEHGRFTAENSVAYQIGFLPFAVVNLWALRLKTLLKFKFPFLKITTTTYQFQPSFDVDMAWAFLHKGFLRTGGAIAKDILSANFKNLIERLKVMSGKSTDPFFSFDYIHEIHQGDVPKPIFFFLLGKHGKFDKNTSPDSIPFQQLIQQISSQYEIGIHPSYQSNEQVDLIIKEKELLEKITKKKIVKSRQHFLKLKFPDTYRQLIAAGLKEDYSMGYADALGFRASISTPFFWYDLQKEEITDLLIHPFQLMDVTLKEYSELDITYAKEDIEDLIADTKKSKGVFMPIWHNSSFAKLDGWDGWSEVYLHLLKKAQT